MLTYGQVLGQLVIGKSYKQTVAALQLSPRTVEHSIDRVKVKVGVRTKFQLVDFMQEYY